MSICHLCGGAGTCPFCDGQGRVPPIPLVRREAFFAQGWTLPNDAHDQIMYALAEGTVPYELMMRARAYLMAGAAGTRPSSEDAHGQDQ